MKKLKILILVIVSITISYPLLWRLIAYSDKKIIDQGSGKRVERTEIIHVLPYIEFHGNPFVINHWNSHPPFNSHSIFYEYFEGNMPIERGGYVLKSFYTDDIVEDGEWTKWYENDASGKVMTMGSYSNGKKEGKWLEYGKYYLYENDKITQDLGDADDIFRK